MLIDSDERKAMICGKFADGVDLWCGFSKGGKGGCDGVGKEIERYVASELVLWVVLVLLLLGAWVKGSALEETWVRSGGIRLKANLPLPQSPEPTPSLILLRLLPSLPLLYRPHHLLIRPLKPRIQKRPQIKPIIIRPILLQMQTRRQHRHLVPVNRIIVKEPPRFLVHLSRTEMIPHVQEFFKHAPGPAFVDFAQAPEDGEFGVGHAHVGLVGLGVGGGDGLEFGGWGRGEEGGEDREGEGFFGVGDEGFEVGFGDAADLERGIRDASLGDGDVGLTGLRSALEQSYFVCPEAKPVDMEI